MRTPTRSYTTSDDLTFVHEGVFRARYRFVSGKLRFGTVKQNEFEALQAKQAIVPVAVQAEGRTWWWFRGKFYCGDDDLTSSDVEALLLQRERRKERQLKRAHASVGLSTEPVIRREPIPEEVQRAVWERDGGSCVRCGSTFNIQYDHIIPFSRGGASSFENLQILCAECNRAKGADIGSGDALRTGAVVERTKRPDPAVKGTLQDTAPEMSQNNVEIVGRWIDAYNRRDTEALIELADPDSHSREDFHAIFKIVEESYNRFEAVPEELIDAGAAVLMVGYLDFEMRDGAETKNPIVSAYWLRTGKVFRIQSFEDRSEALEAVGLSERDAPADS